MNNVKQIFGGNLRQFGMIGALVILILLFQVLHGMRLDDAYNGMNFFNFFPRAWDGFLDGRMLTPVNMINLVNGNAYILILAIGMVLVIIAGHIDLSVGSVAAFVGIVVALVIQDWGVPWWLGIIIGLALGALIGAWQGFWVAVVGIPAFIVTLAGMLLFRGLNQAIGHSATVPVPEEIQFLGGGFLPEGGPDTGFNNLTLLLGLLGIAAVIFGELRSRSNSVKIGSTVPPLWVTVTRIGLVGVVIIYATYLFATGNKGTSFPFSGVILGILVLIYAFVSSKTILGRHVYAVGGNKHAAELSGVKSRKINFLVIMNMSILAAVAAMVFIGRAGASGPGDGTGWELDAIAAVFIGGAAVSGGVGTVIGSMIGGLVMAVLNQGLQLIGMGADMTQVIKGLVLLIAVAIDVYNKSQGRPSIIGLMMKNTNRKEKVGLQSPTEQVPVETSTK
ncbi:putative multiple sugar transport system permease protein [Psychromicrobium silvestre]|uniref:Xylose transport system permease protein XylH n=1 Tax=Psychromicrobium silvestre TaxID=1645614 RepID=A0A7Y9LVQ0_9MICC|nr:sugar ABC transporter permease [Psychromicrobium silvestre]NYE96446.1 putative multiple sugar transport system permease protein [Psychromicrobium silvestre]